MWADSAPGSPPIMITLTGMSTYGRVEPIYPKCILRGNEPNPLHPARPGIVKRNGGGAVVKSAIPRTGADPQGWHAYVELRPRRVPSGAMPSVVERLRNLSRERGMIV